MTICPRFEQPKIVRFVNKNSGRVYLFDDASITIKDLDIQDDCPKLDFSPTDINMEFDIIGDIERIRERLHQMGYNRIIVRKSILFPNKQSKKFKVVERTKKLDYMTIRKNKSKRNN